MTEKKCEARLHPGFIDRLRKFSGLQSDAAIAGAMGISPQTFSTVAKTEKPTWDFVIGLYRAFGMQPGEAVRTYTVDEHKKAV